MTATINESYEVVEIEAVRPHPSNPREGDLDAIQESVEANGFYGALIVQRSSGYILAGNHRWQAARASGLTEIPVIYVDIEDDEAERILLADNRTNDRAKYRENQLGDLLERVAMRPAGLAGTGYDPQDLRQLLGRIAKGEAAGAGPGGIGGKAYTDAEQAEQLRHKWGTERGQLWTVKGKAGEHRILIDDALQDETQERLLGPVGGEVQLVVTDPPYALFGGSQGTADDITDDRIVRPFFEQLFRLIYSRLETFGHAYVFCDWRSWSTIWDTARTERLRVKNCIVWDKGGGLGTAYMNWHEMIAFVNKLPPETTMAKRQSGVRTVGQGNVMRFPRATGDERMHNAAKPVELVEALVRNSSEARGVVLDPFLGSGTTAVACERLGRACVGFEIEPKFAAVTLERLKLAGLDPELATS